MADIGIGISIGMNLKLGICIWYQSEFRVSVSGIRIIMDLQQGISIKVSVEH